jgi:hypothetical protein
VDDNLPAIVILAVYGTVAAGVLTVVVAGRLIRRAARARRREACASNRQEAACERDVPHDRVNLKASERTAFMAIWARLELDEERARLQHGEEASG